MKQPPRTLSTMLNAPAQNPDETTFTLKLSDWDQLRLTIAARELRLRSRMSIADIAKALKATSDEVKEWLRKPGRTREEFWLSELAVDVRVLAFPKHQTAFTPVLVRVKNLRPPSTKAKAARRS